jgi:hypothetical protein
MLAEESFILLLLTYLASRNSHCCTYSITNVQDLNTHTSKVVIDTERGRIFEIENELHLQSLLEQMADAAMYDTKQRHPCKATSGKGHYIGRRKRLHNSMTAFGVS